MTETRNFGLFDWILFAAMLTVSVSIGIFYAVKDAMAKKSGDSAEFLMGGRKMTTLPVAISILVSFMSAIIILGTPAEMYTAGTMFSLSVLGMAISIILTAVLFVPLLHPLKLTSGYEYLERRFNSRMARLTGTFIAVVSQILYMGIATFAPSTALEAVTGFPTWGTIVIVGSVATFYTFLGGIKAVIWTDVFQSFVMLAGMLAIVIKGTLEVGGFTNVWSKNEEWGRIEFWNPDPDPTVRHTTWSVVFGQAGVWLTVFGVNQASVQRYCAVETLRQSRCAMLLNVPGVAILVLLTSMAGIVMFAYYASAGCDPLTDGQVQNANQLIPLFVMDVLGMPGIPGLFISCLFSGALSTMSSCLNALSAVTWEDVLKPAIGDRLSETAKTWIMRVLVLVYGAAGIGFAFVASTLSGTVFQASISFYGASSSALVGIFLLGGLFPWANWIGCVVGGVVGLVVSMWISIGAYTMPKRGYSLAFPSTNCSNAVLDTSGMQSAATTTTMAPIVDEITGVQLLYTISYLWFPAIGMTTVVAVGLVISFITGPMRIGETPPEYLIPVFDRLLCCLPERVRTKLRCNIDSQDSENKTDDKKGHGDEHDSSGQTETATSFKIASLASANAAFHKEEEDKV